MIIIAHRINTINALKNLSFKYGVEVDIRSKGKKSLFIMIHLKKERVFLNGLNILTINF